MRVNAASKWQLGAAFQITIAFLVAFTSTQAGSLNPNSESPKLRESSDDIFAKLPVSKFQIELSRDALNQLRAEPRKSVHATIHAMGEVWNNVSLHLKGKGSFRPIDDKPNLTLDFTALVPGQNFHGLRKFHLNNSIEDPTYLNELIGSELFRAAGIPTPRVGHALVELNGRALGFYVLRESFDKEFLGRNFSRREGALYEPEALTVLNPPLKRKFGEGELEGSTDPTKLCAAIANADPHQRWQMLQKEIDLDRFIAFMAMEIMTCHWDGYSLGRNNYRIYHDPGCGKYVFLPAGMDQLFGNPRLPWKPQTLGPIAKAVLETPEGRVEYSRTFRTLFETLFRSTELTNRMNRVLFKLRPLLNAGQFAAIRSEANSLAGAIVARENYLREQLRQPE